MALYEKISNMEKVTVTLQTGVITTRIYKCNIKPDNNTKME